MIGKLNYTLLLGLLFAACGDDKDGETGDTGTATPADTDTDTDADADTDTDTDTDTDVMKKGLLGLTGYLGQATAITDDSYNGWEEWYFVAEEGKGDDLCRIRYTVTSTGIRDDCDWCEWAFDVTYSKPEVLAESGPGCLGTIGLDKAGIAALDGQTNAYGYAPDYFGHTQTFMIYTEVKPGTWVWKTVTFATWDAKTEIFDYNWEAAFKEYEE